jgi:hypothetical protein
MTVAGSRSQMNVLHVGHQISQRRPRVLPV